MWLLEQNSCEKKVCIYIYVLLLSIKYCITYSFKLGQLVYVVIKSGIEYVGEDMEGSLFFMYTTTHLSSLL